MKKEPVNRTKVKNLEIWPLYVLLLRTGNNEVDQKVRFVFRTVPWGAHSEVVPSDYRPIK